MAQTTPEPWTAPPAELPPSSPPSPSLPDRSAANLPAVAVAAISSVGLVIGSLMRWTVVEFDGTVISELSRSGWGEGDGKITMLIGVGGLIAAALLLGGVRETWLRLGLAVAGGVAVLDSLLAFLDATSSGKPGRIADALGILDRGITVDAGYGVFVAALAGIGLAVTALLFER